MSLALYPSRVRSSDLLGGTHLYYFAFGVRFGNGLPRLSQRFDMQLDGFANELEHFATRFAGRDASREIGNVCPVLDLPFSTTTRYSITRPLVLLQPWVLRMLLSVPGGMSKPSFPATVTVPDFTGCCNWRWLPLVRTWCQPSFCNSRITSSGYALHCLVADELLGRLPHARDAQLTQIFSELHESFVQRAKLGILVRFRERLQRTFILELLH